MRRILFVAYSVMILSTIVPTHVVAERIDSAKTDPSMSMVTSMEELGQLARATAEQPFVPRAAMPEPLAKLQYEQYREIRFRPERGVWWGGDSPFSLEMFHRGFVQRDRVSLFTIDQNRVSEIPFSPKDYHYGIPLAELDSLKDAGHAGVKIAGRFPGYSDAQEMLTFLGSSYFRARSGETVYGTSARGLAVNIGLPRDEEFPYFKAFWITKPQPNSTQLETGSEATDQTLKVLALMDSPTVCGAYEFELTPGSAETRISVRCTLYFRTVPEKIGLAPLTSMWIWGDGLEGPPLDQRPAVHDADGLLIQTENDGWIWRAFARQSYPSVTRVAVDGMRGFGLLQRNRAFYHFDDHNALYHKRPSVWIEPSADWPQGAIEVLELPGAHEGVDNIAAYWIPDQKPQVGKPMKLQYDVLFFPGDRPDQTYAARATNFSVDRKANDTIKLTVRFAGAAVKQMCDGTISIDASFVRGELISKSIVPTDTSDWLATLVFRPTEEAPVEISMSLMDVNRRLSERFMYLCPHEEPSFMYPQVYTRKE